MENAGGERRPQDKWRERNARYCEAWIIWKSRDEGILESRAEGVEGFGLRGVMLRMMFR